MKIAALIPARHASTRLPGKPLALLAGREMILHVCDRAREAGVFAAIGVATDDRRIEKVVRKAGFQAWFSRVDFASGSDRCAWAAKKLPPAIDWVINLQGDEPLVDPRALADLAVAMKKGKDDMYTLAAPLADSADFHNPSVVKVVLDGFDRALYFSRSPIPFPRQAFREGGGLPLRHIGVYGFRREFLARFSRLKPTPASTAESLEQLRALEHGHSIRVIRVVGANPGVDTPEDLARVRALLEARRMKEATP